MDTGKLEANIEVLFLAVRELVAVLPVDERAKFAEGFGGAIADCISDLEAQLPQPISIFPNRVASELQVETLRPEYVRDKTAALVAAKRRIVDSY